MRLKCSDCSFLVKTEKNVEDFYKEYVSFLKNIDLIYFIDNDKDKKIEDISELNIQHFYLMMEEEDENHPYNGVEYNISNGAYDHYAGLLFIMFCREKNYKYNILY